MFYPIAIQVENITISVLCIKETCYGSLSLLGEKRLYENATTVYSVNVLFKIPAKQYLLCQTITTTSTSRALSAPIFFTLLYIFIKRRKVYLIGAKAKSISRLIFQRTNAILRSQDTLIL